MWAKQHTKMVKLKSDILKRNVILMQFILKTLTPDIAPHFFDFDSAQLGSFVSIKQLNDPGERNQKKKLLN